MNETTGIKMHAALPDDHYLPVYTGAKYVSVPTRVIPMITFSPLEKRYNALFKQAFDLVITSIGIIAVLSWLVPLTALIIRLDSKGPVFFLQKRNKKNGKLFTCIKFRTMVVNPEADMTGARENDERITRVGRFLRKHHIDEFPQLFNVLIGDMSLIGPRPHMVAENVKYELLVKEYPARYRIKPGITGLAQAYGFFGFTDNIQQMNERIKLDIQYITKWSPWMDIRILYKTFLSAW